MTENLTTEDFEKWKLDLYQPPLGEDVDLDADHPWSAESEMESFFAAAAAFGGAGALGDEVDPLGVDSDSGPGSEERGESPVLRGEPRADSGTPEGALPG